MRIVAVYLLVWVPLNFAFELMSALPSLGMRGAKAIAELTFHALVAALSVAASRMIPGSPSARPAAAAAVTAAGAVAIQSLYWTVLPRNTAPGTRGPLTIFWIAVTGILLVGT